jgi:hypothetical protein
MAESRLTRRAFVGVGLGTAAAIGVAGWFGRGGQVAAQQRKALPGFMHVSRLVTGVDDLPANLGPIYLDKLAALDLHMSPVELAQLGGGAGDLRDLERSVFGTPGGRECAEHVAGAWWSGTVGDEVVTYTDALIWRGVPFAHPQTDCLGATGAWAKPGRLAA